MAIEHYPLQMPSHLYESTTVGRDWCVYHVRDLWLLLPDEQHTALSRFVELAFWHGYWSTFKPLDLAEQKWLSHQQLNFPCHITSEVQEILDIAADRGCQWALGLR